MAMKDRCENNGKNIVKMYKKTNYNLYILTFETKKQ